MVCEYLGIDLTVDKNRYPHDFKRWHDIRTNEYRSEKAKSDEENKKEFYNKFGLVANKYGVFNIKRLVLFNSLAISFALFIA